MIKLNNSYLPGIVERSGYLTLNSLAFLYNLVKNIQPVIQPLHILELGTGTGCSAVFMALGMKKGQIISIDNHMDNCQSLSIPRKNANSCSVANKIKFIVGSSFDSGELAREIKPEMVFMDASHNVSALWAEYHSFQPILQKDHIIVVDDLYSITVREFVTGLSKKYQSCIEVPFHDGMAILNTNNHKYLPKITKAILEVDNAEIN